MANFNKVVLIGRLTRDPETRAFPSGGMVAKFGFAVTNRRKNGQTGQWEDEPMFIDCEAFNRGEIGKLADIVRDRCRKGSQVMLEGRLHLDQWDDKTTGQKRSKHKIVVETLQLLDPRHGRRRRRGRRRCGGETGMGGGSAGRSNSGGGGSFGGNRGGGGGSGGGGRGPAPQREPVPPARRTTTWTPAAPGRRRRGNPVLRPRLVSPCGGAGRPRPARPTKASPDGEDQHQAQGRRAEDRRPAGRSRRRRSAGGSRSRRGTNGGMLLVLVEDVAHVGKSGDLVEVKPGYGRNFLIPYGLAVVPTEHNLQLLEKHKIKVQKAREARIADLKVLAEQLSRLPSVMIEANATEEGHLYGSIGPVEISKTLKGKNLMVEPDMVKLEHPIKEANTLTEVPLALGYGIEAKIQVLVVALQQAAPAKK